MRLTSASATFVLAFAALVSAAPASYEQTTAISKRDAEIITDLSETVKIFQAKRETYEKNGELEARAYDIVTEILSALNDTNLAPKIIQGLIDNTSLQPLVTDATIAIIKSGLINLTTLFTALNDSGLAASVIQSLISDCLLYAAIYQLALSEISGFLLKFESAKASTKREYLEPAPAAVPAPLAARDYDPDGVVNNLLESLAQSGLASSVVRQLIVDPEFLKYGASLVKTLLDENLIDFGALISALKDSGLVGSLFKEFFTVGTLQTVITNALAAAAGQCGTVSNTATATFPTRSATATTGGATATATTTSKPNGSCRKKRRAY